MVVRTQAPTAAGRPRQKHRSIFTCCIAIPDTHSDSGDSAFIEDSDDALAPQQQPLPQWKQLQQQQQEDQQPPGIRTVTISSSATPSDTSNDVAALQQHQQQCTPNAARSLVTRAVPSTAATYNSTLPSRTVTPLTDFLAVPTSAAKPTAAATAVSSSAVGQAFSKASRSIQQCGTGDSPSEIHSDLAADHHHHHQQQQQQQQGGFQAGTNSPVRRLDSHSVSRSISGSCQATASSAGSSSSSCSVVSAAAAAAAEIAAAKACGSDRAKQVIALSPAGPAECELEGLTEEYDRTIANTSDAQGTDQSDVRSDSTPPEASAGSLCREISLSPAASVATPPPAAAAVDSSSSSTSGSNNLDAEELAGAAAGRTFRFSNSSSFPGLAAAAVDSPSSTTAAASPFAQLSLQKTVANTLLSSAKRSAATMPASVASFTTAASTSAAAAAGVRVSSSSGPAALGGVTSRASRVSWATASTVLGAEPSEVFEVLDPEAASADDGHKMLKRSASASSVSALGSSTSTSRNKLQQLRSAMSFGGTAARSKAATIAAAADSSARDDQAAAAVAAPGSGFKKVWRRSTEFQATSSSRKGPDSSATVARRSKSAHENILAQQQQQRVRQLSDQGLPPPYPAAAAASTAAGRHSSSLGSSGRLAAGEVQSSSSSIGLGASGSSGSSPDMGRQLDRCRISMGSAPAKSGDGSGSTGSLVGLAVTRMHTARSAPVLSMPTSSSTSSSTAASGMSSMGSMTSSSSSNLASAAMSPGQSSIDFSRASSVQIVNAFADAFLAALAAGNTKWASQGALAQMLHDQAKMLGIDKQLYVGKPAIIRRLNSGMDQLVKMVGAYVDNTSSSSSGGGGGGDAGPLKGPDQSNVMSDLATQMPKPLLSVTCPDPKTKPSTVVALYTFKWGIRKFTFRDEFIVKNGQIMRLRRSRS